ncbi:MAG: hypothetical protein JWO31_3664, partial [Phycisphaerales bacterium]|nr:hypothetical protein [Phycisphaerales bacterium]
MAIRLAGAIPAPARHLPAVRDRHGPAPVDPRPAEPLVVGRQQGIRLVPVVGHRVYQPGPCPTRARNAATTAPAARRNSSRATGRSSRCSSARTGVGTAGGGSAGRCGGGGRPPRRRDRSRRGASAWRPGPRPAVTRYRTPGRAETRGRPQIPRRRGPRVRRTRASPRVGTSVWSPPPRRGGRQSRDRRRTRRPPEPRPPVAKAPTARAAPSHELTGRASGAACRRDRGGLHLPTRAGHKHGFPELVDVSADGDDRGALERVPRDQVRPTRLGTRRRGGGHRRRVPEPPVPQTSARVDGPPLGTPAPACRMVVRRRSPRYAPRWSVKGAQLIRLVAVIFFGLSLEVACWVGSVRNPLTCSRCRFGDIVVDPAPPSSARTARCLRCGHRYGAVLSWRPAPSSRS